MSSPCDCCILVVLCCTLVFGFYFIVGPLTCYGDAKECCSHHADYNPNAESLAETFDDRLFGQPLAHITILGAVSGHVTNPNPSKPLVLSLHGPAGTGKNHISRLMVENLRPRGMKSKFVTVQMSMMDYSQKDQIERYKRELVALVKSKVSQCSRHIFIFDEMESMPAGLLDSIKDFLDHHDTVDGIDFRKAMFIFRSNLASTAISKHVQDLWEKGIPRENITLLEMEKIIRDDILHDPNAGFYKAKIINSHLISHFIPFLPLEKSHVRQCIQAEFWERGRWPNLVVENEVLEQLEFDGPNDSKVFAVKGCKNVAEKVNVMLYQKRNMNRKFMHSEL